jgi:hypothetical protein
MGWKPIVLTLRRQEFKKNYNAPAKDATNFFLRIAFTAGPTTSLPLGDNLFFKSITLFSLNLKIVPSRLDIENLDLIIRPLSFVFFLIQLFGIVFWTLHFTKSPTLEDFLLKPLYKWNTFTDSTPHLSEGIKIDSFKIIFN